MMMRNAVNNEKVSCLQPPTPRNITFSTKSVNLLSRHHYSFLGCLKALLANTLLLSARMMMLVVLRQNVDYESEFHLYGNH
jgi:hypothetical protein